MKLIAEEDRTCWLAQIGIFSWSIQSLQPCRRLITYYSIFIHQELLQRNSNMISKNNLESNICVRLNNSQNENRVVGGREDKKYLFTKNIQEACSSQGIKWKSLGLDGYIIVASIV